VAEQQDSAKKPTVLILEDDSCSALALSILLEDRGCDVHICPSVDLARTFIPLQVPDILVADWNVDGGISSLELARQMRRIRPELRVFFVSGHLTEDLQRELVDVEGCGIFEKPLDYDYFMRQVQEGLSNGGSEGADDGVPTLSA
jgi:DNA-binding NtrC family response regulator